MAPLELDLNTALNIAATRIPRKGFLELPAGGPRPVVELGLHAKSRGLDWAPLKKCAAKSFPSQPLGRTSLYASSGASKM